MKLGISLSDSATLTASSELSRLPAIAIQRTQPRDIWRSYDNTDQNLVFDFGSVTSFNFVAVLYHNVDENGLWRIRSADTEANLTAAPTYDSSTMAMRNSGDDGRFDRFHCVKDTGAQSNRWVRLDFTTLTGVSNLNVGRVMICNALDLAPAYDWQIIPLEDALVIPTISSLWINKGRRRRELSWTYPGMTDTQAFATSGDIDQIAFSTGIVAAVDEAQAARATDWTLYGTISNVSNIYHFANINRKQYQLIEYERP